MSRYSTLRFMQWMGANEKRDEALDWSNRRTPLHASQTGSVSVEHMVDLCNRLAANPWFTIPHNATDDYVRQFARYVRRTLRPDVRVYLEHSNEVWNTLFPQGRFAQAEGLRRGLSTQAYEAGYRYHAQRSHEIFSIWQEEFSAVIPSEYRRFNDVSATAAPTLVRVLVHCLNNCDAHDAFVVIQLGRCGGRSGRDGLIRLRKHRRHAGGDDDGDRCAPRVYTGHSTHAGRV